MPRRVAPDAYAAEVGARIRELRRAREMSMQDLADRSGIGSKGHLSNLERGLVRPNIFTIAQLARGLEVDPLDLLAAPRRSKRERVVEATRHLNGKQLGALLAWLARQGWVP